jgi:hypothetical protein
MEYSSDGLRVDFVVSAVCTDETDVNDPIGIVDPNYNAILIACDIEDRSAIPQNARASE